jgi:CubicO group peptidase (beta-lactamase class C family)
MRRIFLASVAFVAGVPFVAAQAELSKRPAEEISAARIRNYWKSLDLIGFRGVGLVEREGKELFFESARGVASTATFDIASIAKSITAVAILRLASRDKLRLEDSLEHFFPGAPPDKKAITVHQLLTHTGGVGNQSGDTAMGVRDRGEAVRMILATLLEAPPGTEYNYSNDGYTLLAAVAEVATSKTWEEVIREEVLRPAGMTHTIFRGDSLPEGAGALARSTKQGATDPDLSAQWGSKGGAGILSTAQDLKRFMDAAVDGTLLGPDGRQELGRSYAPPERLVQYGRVFDLRNLPGAGPIWGHGGADSDIDHYSIVEYYPKRGVVLVLLALEDEVLMHEVATGFRNAVFGLGSRDRLPSRRGRPAKRLRPSALEGAGLRFRIEDGPPETLLPEDPAATEFLLARSKDDREQMERCVALTRSLIAQAEEFAVSESTPPEGPVGRFLQSWRDANKKDGPVKEVRVIGAAPNWVDTLGGILSFVHVDRERGSSVFRFYWANGKLVARGGSVIPNPAPLRLIDLGGGHYGAWNPALGTYVKLTLKPAKEGVGGAGILQSGGRIARLKIVSPSATPAH